MSDADRRQLSELAGDVAAILAERNRYKARAAELEKAAEGHGELYGRALYAAEHYKAALERIAAEERMPVISGNGSLCVWCQGHNSLHGGHTDRCPVRIALEALMGGAGTTGEER
jgi:hypothetical protein